MAAVRPQFSVWEESHTLYNSRAVQVPTPSLPASASHWWRETKGPLNACWSSRTVHSHFWSKAPGQRRLAMWVGSCGLPPERTVFLYPGHWGSAGLSILLVVRGELLSTRPVDGVFRLPGPSQPWRGLNSWGACVFSLTHQPSPEQSFQMEWASLPDRNWQRSLGRFPFHFLCFIIFFFWFSKDIFTR